MAGLVPAILRFGGTVWNTQAPHSTQKENGGAWPRRSHSCRNVPRDQRLENWNERRALARPYFLRSTTRLSRVMKPPFLRGLRSSGS